MTLICGIDEAGRGPVLGHLAIAAVVCDEQLFPELKKLGVKDSKLLTQQKGEQLFSEITARAVAYEIRIVQPDEIDKAVDAQSSIANLNWLEADVSLALLAKLQEMVQSSRAILDCQSPNKKAYRTYLYERLKDKTLAVVAEHKADVNYVIVGAASILAKVTREKEIERLQQESGIDFGSGYLTDPKTRDFLKNNPGASFVRKSWSSYKRIEQEKQQSSLLQFNRKNKEE